VLKIFFFVTLIIICTLANHSIYAAQNDKDNNFNIAVAADWGCDENAEKTVQNIQSKNPEIVIANGDLSYKKSSQCWFDTIQPLKSKMKIAMGDHEYSDTSGGALGVMNQYLKPLNLQKTYYSFDINNVHVTVIDPFIDYKSGSPQYKFIDNDLKTASTNSNIDWIFAVQSTPMYTSPSKHSANYTIIDTYYPLFDKYDVDLVLSSDNHNYQRTFPLDYNSKAASSDNNNPIIVNKNQKNYHSINYNTYKDNDNNGIIYLITGTAGRSLYELEGQASFIAKQDDKHFGFLNIEINDKTLKGTFYANENKLPQNFYSDYHNNIVDQFTISKTNDLDKNKGA
jgi:Calcineurin-like phosphoesterase